jgi:hypothetical protein
VRYVVGVITVDKRKTILLKYIPSEGDAKALEKEIERWLGIVDKPAEDELRSIHAASGVWTRLTYSPSTGAFSDSSLFYLLLGAPFVAWGTLILASGQILIGRWNHKTVSFDNDPVIFGVLVLMILGAAGWCFYKSWRIFVNIE